MLFSAICAVFGRIHSACDLVIGGISQCLSNAAELKFEILEIGRNSNLDAGGFITASENEKSLPHLAVRQGQFWGWEFATLSFPCRHWALTSQRLPASRRYSPGKWSFRPRSRAVWNLSISDFEWGFSARFGWWLRHRLTNQVQTHLWFLLCVWTTWLGSATGFAGALARATGLAS